MVGPIDLDGEANLGASKVDDGVGDDELPAKSEACLRAREPAPEPLLRASGRKTHEAGPLLEELSLPTRKVRVQELGRINAGGKGMNGSQRERDVRRAWNPA